MSFGQQNEEHFRKTYLNPALASGLIEMTTPEKNQQPPAIIPAYGQWPDVVKTADEILNNGVEQR